MALSLMLGQAGFTPRRIHTTAKAYIEKAGEGFKITHIDLDTEAEIPNINERQFQEQAESAKSGCPASQALAGTKINLNASMPGW
jgi:osmotically inducible protein OsmC